MLQTDMYTDIPKKANLWTMETLEPYELYRGSMSVNKAERIWEKIL